MEQRERDALFHLLNQYQIELRSRDILNLKRQDTLKELALKQEENPASKELCLFYPYLNRLAHEIEECEKRLSQLELEIQAQKKIVVEASKKTKTLATMKAKKKKEYILGVEKQEQKEVDDLAVRQFAAKEQEYPKATETYEGRTDIKPNE